MVGRLLLLHVTLAGSKPGQMSNLNYATGMAGNMFTQHSLDLKGGKKTPGALPKSEEAFLTSSDSRS